MGNKLTALERASGCGEKGANRSRELWLVVPSYVVRALEEYDGGQLWPPSSREMGSCRKHHRGVAVVLI